MDRIRKEGELRHFEAFFQEWEKYGALEHMKPVCSTEEEQRRQKLNSDLYTMTRSLKREPLRMENIRDFQLWRRDILDAWEAMCLSMEHYKVTVNQFMVSRLDIDMQATVTNLLPQDEKEFEDQEPTELFEKIKKRLDKATTEEFRNWRFMLAKQRIDEDPGKYKNRLFKYYEEQTYKMNRPM